MLRPNLKTIEIRGFRSFGAEQQTAEIDAPIAAIWGPNSKGKTSFAEAVEFLLTGQTVKREVLSSRQAEFAGALRNAHIDSDIEAYVSATIECPDGQIRVIKRTLDADYSKQQDCQSTLTIDGTVVTEDDLISNGIVLAQPPLRTPVLAQHTLNYLFTARPTDRSSYFKALLEVTDLDNFRDEVLALENSLITRVDLLLEKFDRAKSIPIAASHFLVSDLTDSDVLQNAFEEATEALLEFEGLPIPEQLAERVLALQQQLDVKRSKTFPLDLFGRKKFGGLAAPSEDDWKILETYVTERDKVDEQTKNLISLFKVLLEIPAVASADKPQDCPVCETESALTTERIQAIRDIVASSDTFVQAEASALTVLRHMQLNLRDLQENLNSTLPQFERIVSAARRAAGFTIDRIASLLGDEAQSLVSPWIKTLSPLIREHRSLLTQCVAVKQVVDDYVASSGKLDDIDTLKKTYKKLHENVEQLTNSEADYANASRPLYETLKSVVDSQGDTSGWQELIELASILPDLRESIIEQAIRSEVKSEIQAALRQIEKAIDAVLDAKFELLTEAIDKWWMLLRGGESTFFSAVKRRGKITIDFKGGLSPNEDQSDPKIRDVIAVFSDSQLHCLGLAIFLARAEHYGTSFVVLDDPVLTSDEDYKVHFRTQVMGHLQELGIQTIVLTQHKSTQRDIADVNGHFGVDQFQIDISDPSIGSVINKTSDEFSAMLARAAAFTSSNDILIRRPGGKQLRVATERFCKMLLVKKRREGGDATAAISDYDGLMLGGGGGLVELVTPYLIIDPSHPGKLKVICNDLNPPAHDDDAVPTRQALREALGNLKKFRKDYLL
jgi:hypothetical protein